MRRYIIPILIMFLVLGALAYMVLNTTLIFSSLIPGYVKTHYPGIRIKNLTIQKQTFRLPDKLILYQTHFVLEKNGRPYEIDMDEASIYDIAKYETNRRRFRIFVQGLNVKSQGVVAKNFNLRLLVSDFVKGLTTSFDGIFEGERWEYLHYRLGDVAARCKGDFNKFQIFEAKIRGYGGQGQGQLSVEIKPNPSVMLWLELYGMDPEELQALDKDFFQNIQGRLDGTIRVIKSQNTIDLLAINFNLGQGGALKSPLMGQAFPFIAGEKQPLVKDIMDKIGSFPVDKASLYLQNSEPQKLIAMFNLENKEFDIRVKGNKEIPVPQGLMTFVLRPQE